jgi:hypothetical protein
MKELNSYSKAGQIVQEVFSSIRTVFSLNGGIFEQKRYVFSLKYSGKKKYFIFRYEKELQETLWTSIRKGAALSLFIGWSHFTTYLIYGAGFIFGSMLMHYEGRSNLNLSDILVVSHSSKRT